MNELQIEIAQVAARLIAEEGWPWSGAKQRALRELGLPPRTALPGSDLVEDKLREHLALFQADTQPAELLQLRRLALRWMERLECFEPLLTGAVWRGTANRLSDIRLQLFADDPKAPDIALLNLGVQAEAGPEGPPRRVRGARRTACWSGCRRRKASRSRWRCCSRCSIRWRDAAPCSPTAGA
jgi:hypothetical protein